jgi:hypothetical protein
MSEVDTGTPRDPPPSRGAAALTEPSWEGRDGVVGGSVRLEVSGRGATLVIAFLAFMSTMDLQRRRLDANARPTVQVAKSGAKQRRRCLCDIFTIA